MRITRLKLTNWRNFRSLDIAIGDVTYVLGPNASGKSNLLDVFRFLRDVCKPRGGGLQAAVSDRGGISRLRCLHARQNPAVRIEVDLREAGEDGKPWRYVLEFAAEPAGNRRTLVSCEEVWCGDKVIVSRPSKDDKADEARLEQTHLEQVQANQKFRDIVALFAGTTYLHLVPQLLRYADSIGGRTLADDPFGQGFLERIAKTSARTRDSRLNRIQAALAVAVPRFEGLRFQTDEIGRPHLAARYKHFRPKAGWQTEEQFSDGTLRLIGLLWSLLDGDSLLLLEEPEISLNEDIVRQLPALIDRAQRGKRKRRQVLISTHSHAMLSNEGIDAESVVLLEVTEDGTIARAPHENERDALDAGLSVADVLLPSTRPPDVEQLKLLP
jgi:predicted ATPase